MTNNLEVIIGIENHVQLKTKTKMFSRAQFAYHNPPNSTTRALDLGLPGAMPTVNQAGVALAIRAGLAFKMTFAPLLMFDRKNYYYSDLAKGFQITQFFEPIAQGGAVKVQVGDQEETIALERIQIEEDTAKQIHTPNYTFLDYNRSGVGLLEIITKPVMHDATTVIAYQKKLIQTLQFLQVSDAKMNEGSFRCDVNISLRPLGAKTLGNRVEIKNINSLANIKKAIEFEIKAQTEIIMQGKTVVQATKRFSEEQQRTILMRLKEQTLDYRFFTEPNIQPVVLEKAWIEKIKANMPLLPDQIFKTYVTKYNLKPSLATQLVEHYDYFVFFNKLVNYDTNYQIAANYLLGDVWAYLHKNSLSLKASKLKVADLAKIVNLQTQEKISSKQAKALIKIVLEEGGEPQAIIDKLGWTYLTDEATITNILQDLVKNNQAFIDKHQERPDRIKRLLMGKLMQATKNNCSPQKGQQMIDKILLLIHKAEI